MTDQELDALNDQADLLYRQIDTSESHTLMLRHELNSIKRRIDVEERDRLLRTAVKGRLQDRLKA